MEPKLISLESQSSEARSQNARSLICFFFILIMAKERGLRYSNLFISSKLIISYPYQFCVVCRVHDNVIAILCQSGFMESWPTQLPAVYNRD